MRITFTSRSLALLLVIATPLLLFAQAPTISSIVPNSAIAGSPALTLNLTGTNFNAASQVQWNGGARPTSFLSSTQLTAAIPASDLASAGVASVTVFNPTTGLTSNAQPFTITSPGPPPPPPPPPPAPRPTLTSAGPSLAVQGDQHLQLTLRGTNFRPNANVVISPPLAALSFSQANQPAADVVIESISQLSSSLIIVVISVGPHAAPGLRAVDVVNTDLTNTGFQASLGSSTSKPLNISVGNSLAAPLGIRTIAITQPRDGLVIPQGDDFFGEAILAGTGTGVVTGEWVWDNSVSEQFAVNMAGGERVLLRTQHSLPTLSLGLHTIQLRITAPNLIESRSVQIVINPGDFRSMRLLAPAPGAVFAAASPPLLRWLPVAGASSYDVGFSSRPIFSSIETWHNVKDSQWRVPQEIWDALPNGDLYWTVRVIDASGETRSPLPMRRITKYPAKTSIRQPEIRGGPVDPTELEMDLSDQTGSVTTVPQSGAAPQLPKQNDAEKEPAPSTAPTQPSPAVETGIQKFNSNKSQISSNTQWTSGSAADINVLALVQQTSFQNGPWRAEINGSSFLNSILGPDPQHALGRANDYVFRLAYDQPRWGTNFRFGILAPVLYTGAEFITMGAARQGVEPSLRTPVGTLAFWTNTNDLAPGAGTGTNFHQRIIGGSYEESLPQNRGLVRAMWLSSRDLNTPLASTFQSDGNTVAVTDSLARGARADAYGGLLLVRLGQLWTWTSEYAWSYSNEELGNASSPVMFGRAWRTGVSGSRWQTQFNFMFRDVTPDFLSSVNPALSRLSNAGRRGTDASLAHTFRFGTLAAGHQFLQSNIGDSTNPPVTLHNLSAGWSKALPAMIVTSLQAHEARTWTGDLPSSSALPLSAVRASTSDFGLTASISRSFNRFMLAVTASRDWFRNLVLNTGNVITSSTGVNANFKVASFFQLNSNLSVNWIAADKNTVGGTTAITTFIQPMLQWQKTGLSISPLITVGQRRTLLSGGILTADTVNQQYGGRLGWRWPHPLDFSIVTVEGSRTNLHNGITGLDQTDSRVFLLWTLVWGLPKPAQ
ncbi:MAG TPA: IPT/TIG domain-containing protein [Candidatus Angelobacter sp.]|nr:IPT/TIG domain-containing protein [Candidatus Angelobacter sp.]